MGFFSMAHIWIYVVAARKDEVVRIVVPHHVQTLKREIGFVIVTTSMCVLTERWMRNEIQATLQSRVSTRDKATMQHLLGAMCDAVVRLQDDLRISAAAPKLANLLLHGSSGESLVGVSITELLQDADRERFVAHLQTGSQSLAGRGPQELASGGWDCQEEWAPALNVRFKASAGTVVQTTVFFTCYLNLRGQVEYVVGLCEVSQDSAPKAPTLAQGEPHTFDENSSTGASSNSSFSPISSTGAVDIVPPLHARFARKTPSFAIVIDALTPELTITQFTPNVALMLGLWPKGVSLLSLVENPRAFNIWVQGCVNKQAHGKLDSLDGLAMERIVLCTELLSKLGMRLRAKVMLTQGKLLQKQVDSGDDFGADHAAFMLHIEFRKLQVLSFRAEMLSDLSLEHDSTHVAGSGKAMRCSAESSYDSAMLANRLAL